MSGGVSGSKDVMRDLLLRGEFSDMEIICQGRTFKAHQAIVCTQSSYFKSAICGGFKETSAKVINLQEDDPETIERVLSFLYLGKYNEAPYLEDKPNDTEPKEIPLSNMEVFIAADKFGIEPLKSLATQKFSRWATANWNSPIFPDVVHEVMTSVPSHESSLREIIVDVISTHITDLIEDQRYFISWTHSGALGH